jgi:hypothetical protein
VEQPIQSSGGKQAAVNQAKLKRLTLDIDSNIFYSEHFYGCPGIPEANSKPFTPYIETNNVFSESFPRFFLNENGRSSAHHLRGKSLESTNNGLRPDKPHPSTLKGRLSPTP